MSGLPAWLIWKMPEIGCKVQKMAKSTLLSEGSEVCAIKNIISVFILPAFTVQMVYLLDIDIRKLRLKHEE